MVTMKRAAKAGLALLAALGLVAPAMAAPAVDPVEAVYAEPGGVLLKLYVFAPPAPAAKPAAAILLFHSGGWVRGKPQWLFGDAGRFAARGLVALPVQYRLSQNGVTPVDALADTCAAFRWVRANAKRLGIDPAQVAGYGASAGGQLIAAAATVGCGGDAAGRPDALLLVSGGVDTENSASWRALAGPAVNPADYSPLAHAGASTPPTLIIQGAEDSVTRTPAARQFCARLNESGGLCRLHVHAGLGHLLTRQLADQRSSVDPDPAAVRLAELQQARFLEDIGFIAAP